MNSDVRSQKPREFGDVDRILVLQNSVNVTEFPRLLASLE